MRLLICLVTLSINLLNAQANQKDIISKIDSIYKNSDIPSFALSVIKNDKVAFELCKGYADKENSIALNRHHAILTASLSKTFIGVALMKAIEEGYFTLETPINDILPFPVVNPYYPEANITIRHLVTHTSGISDNIEDFRKIYFLENPLKTKTKFDKFTKIQIEKALKNKDISYDKLLKEIFTKTGNLYKKSNFTKHLPGENYEYSNTAATLAALLIEEKTGIPYSNYIKKIILNPLGMKHTTFFPTKLKTTNRANLYTGNENQKLTPYQHLLYPIGGLYSNLEDMNIFIREMIKGLSDNGTLLSKSSYKNMFSKQLKKIPLGMKEDEVNQGVFWVFQDDHTIGHTGGGLGASAFMFIDTKNRTGKFFISNCEITSSAKKVNSFIQLWQLMDNIIN